MRPIKLVQAVRTAFRIPSPEITSPPLSGASSESTMQRSPRLGLCVTAIVLIAVACSGGAKRNVVASAPERANKVDDVAEARAVTASFGWARTFSNRLFVSRDAGGSWSDATPTPLGELGILGTAFADEEVGLLATGNGASPVRGDDGRGDVSVSPIVIQVTRDGGRSWRPSGQIHVPFEYSAAEMRSLDTKRWFALVVAKSSSAVDWGYLYRSDDGGANWTLLSSEGNVVPGTISVEFTDDLHGIVVGRVAPAVAVTSDGGRTWSAPNLPGNDLQKRDFDYWYGIPKFFGVTLMLPSTVQHGEDPSHEVMYRSDDFGSTWRPIHDRAMPTSNQIWQSAILSPSTWLVQSGSATFVEYRQGRDSEFHVEGLPEGDSGFVGLSFVNASDGWGILQNNNRGTVFQLFATADTGRTWKDVTPTR